MRRSTLPLLLSLLFLAALVASPAASAGGAHGACAGHLASADYQVRTQALSENVHCVVAFDPAINADFANTGLLFGDEGILVVDGNLLTAGPDLEAAIRALYVEWRARDEDGDAAGDGAAAALAEDEHLPLRYLINTHWHQDHTGTNPYFGLAGARIIAHETVRRRLMLDEKLGEPYPVARVEPEGLPSITFEESLTLHFGGEEVRILHFPGAHTDGDSVVWLPRSKVAFLGDVFYSPRSFPYIELLSGARPAHLLRALEALLELLPEDTLVVPGHGPVTDKDGLRAFHAMLKDCDGQIRSAIEENLSVFDCERLMLFGEYDDAYGGGVRDRARSFLRILWYCYAPESQGGLGELDRERAAREPASDD